jgi:hypothetical protein
MKTRTRVHLTSAFRVAIIIGTVLNVINNWEAVLTNTWSSAAWIKIPLTYAVPFLVSLYSSKKALKTKTKM